MSLESMTSSKTDPLDLAATVPNFRLDPRQRLASEGAGADAVQSLGLRESGTDQRSSRRTSSTLLTRHPLLATSPTEPQPAGPEQL